MRHHKRRRGPRAFLCVAAATAMLAATAGAVSAETVKVFDKVGDGIRYAGDPPKSRHGDIQRFRIDHRYHKVRMRLYASKGGHFEEFTEVWVDTQPRNPGPERLVVFSAEVERFSVSRVGRFFNAGAPGPKPIGRQTCGNRYRWGSRTIEAGIPRACFGYPKRVRVSVQTSAEGFEKRKDWAPGYRQFSRWVGRG